MGYAIDIQHVASRTLAVTRFHVSVTEIATMGDRMGAAFAAVITRLGQEGVSPQGPAVACYERTGDGFDVSAGFPVGEPFRAAGEVGPLALPARAVAHTTHLGPYDQLPAAYDALRAGVEAQGRALDDDAPMWEEYWSGPEAPPEETRTEVFWPVVAS